MDGDELINTISGGYSFDSPAVTLGVLNAEGPVVDAEIRIPLAMFNRHGLIAGATGTGKTITLQVLAEALSASGVPVFAADIKGDLSGLAAPGKATEKLTERVEEQGQPWEPKAYPCEFYALGGEGLGVPVRATVSSFGPILLSKVLGLNRVQESSLGLVFHYADQAGLALLDLKDLIELLKYLTSDEGRAQLKGIGGVSTATAGVILRELATLAAQGGDVFFAEPEFDPADLLYVTRDGLGVISLLELPRLASRPALFSTFLMWLLADLFESLPEVGDLDKPKLVFFFDEAHFLFDDASDAFLDAITQTVRLIRSKGVGIFFVTQTPKDLPEDVLAQLGSRVQHQLRAHTPNDAKALRATVSTYPTSSYDLEAVLQQLGIGEAIVTVMSETGAPTPVARTRVWAPESLMGPMAEEELRPGISQSPQMARYGTPLDRPSAYEALTRRLAEGAAAAEAEHLADRGRPVERVRVQAPPRSVVPAPTPMRRRSSPEPEGLIEQMTESPVFRDLVRTVGREVVRGLFGAGRRR